MTPEELVIDAIIGLTMLVPVGLFIWMRYVLPKQWQAEQDALEAIRIRVANIDLRCEHCGASCSSIRSDACTCCGACVSEEWKVRYKTVAALRTSLFFYARSY